MKPRSTATVRLIVLIISFCLIINFLTCIRSSENDKGKRADIRGIENDKGKRADIRGNENDKGKRAHIRSSENDKGKRADIRSSENDKGKRADIRSSENDKGKRAEIRDLLPDIKEIGKSIDYNGIKRDLWLVCTYLAAHKYFGADFRYLTGNTGPSDQIFYKKFPSPTPGDVHKGVARACETSVMACIEEILSKARLSGSLQHLMKTEDELVTFAPFGNNYEDFKYRRTAMYYLCWHTLLQDVFLGFNEGTQSCLSHLNAVDEIPERKHYKLIKHEIPAIKDIRDNFRADVFTCAHLWFCPDPCYGGKDRGNFVQANFKVKGNPCLDLKNSDCKWKQGANINFHDLVRNRIDTTCDRTSYRVGSEWNSRFGLCLDTDERFNGKADCRDTRICKNTVGSYMCARPRGYDVNPPTDMCERMVAKQSATKLKYKHFEADVKTAENEDFNMKLKKFVGISASTRQHVSFSVEFEWNSRFGLCVDTDERFHGKADTRQLVPFSDRFEWNSRFGLCVDTDERFNGKADTRQLVPFSVILVYTILQNRALY